MLARTADLVAAAYDAGAALLAFNVITLEHAEAIASGAEQAVAPVIMQISENAVKYHGGQLFPLAAAVAAIAGEAATPIAVHLDHVEDTELLRCAADAGVSSVMYDGSKLEYRDNVAATKAAVQWAHAHGVFLEAELGEVGGKDGAHAPGTRTDPDAAAAFVTETGVDALAVAVGSSHAMSSRTAALDFTLIAALREQLSVPLVLHGSSGVADHDLRKAVAAGMTKINIGTMLNVAYTSAVRAELAADPRMTDPRRYLTSARTAMANVISATLAGIREPASDNQRA